MVKDDYIEKTVAKLEHYREVFARKVQVLDETIAVVRALPAEEAALSLVAELPAAADPPPAVTGKPDKKVSTAREKSHYKKSQYPGVDAVKSKHRGIRYKARPRINKKSLYLGTFDTPEAAAAAIEKYKTDKLKSTAAAQKPKKKKSLASSNQTKTGRFIGVSQTTSGKFRTQIWDSKKGKNISVGTFNTDIEAAIAVAKSKGDSDEVRRLSDILEQIENNPDRPKGHRGPMKHQDYPPKDEPETVFRCKHCRLEFQSRPASCPSCGCEKFNEVKNTK